MTWLYLFHALVAGMLVPVQTGLNAMLARHVGGPALSALISFLVGTVVLVAYLVVLRTPVPAWSALSAAPLWLYLGGVVGAFFVTSATLLAPKLGAATLLALIIAGQMIASVIIDHYGMLGFAQHSVTHWKLLGVALLIAGVVLIRYY